MNRDTVGKISSTLIQKEPETRDPIEIEHEIHKAYEEEILKCIDNNKRDIFGDFYVIVITKKEALMQNVLRHYYFARLTCPTPDYDQTVYKYHRISEKIEFLWVIPSKDTCELLRDNKLSVDMAEWGLLGFVLDFYNGTLMHKAKKFNGEQYNSILLDKEFKYANH